MARRSKSPTPSSSDNEKEDDEEEVHHESSRGNTPPRSPTPTETIHTKIPTPPPSPKHTVVVSVPIDPPPTTSQPTISLPQSPPVTTIPISTSPLPDPIISQSTTTTIPDPTVGVNVSDTGATTTTTEPPVFTKPLSPTKSNDYCATLGGENDEYDSTYFGPYRLPSDEDNDDPVSSHHLQGIHDKLDRLLEDNKAYSGVVLKAFLETAIEQYTSSIEKSTSAIDASTSSCKKALTDVTEVVHTTQIFLDSLKNHANISAVKIQASVDLFSKSLQEESTKFEATRSSLQTKNTSFLSSVNSRFASLQVDLTTESAVKANLAKKASTIEVQKVQLAQAKKEISLLKTERAVFRSCAGDVKDMLLNLLGAHDPILTLTIKNHLTTKLIPALAMLHEMNGVSERFVPPKQGGEGVRVDQTKVFVKTESDQPKVTVKIETETVHPTELKDNVASSSGPNEKEKLTADDSDSNVGETIAEALQSKKREPELKEAEERERRNKEEEDALNCKKALFPLWTKEVLVNQAIQFPSVFWLEPLALFDCDNSKDSQFDMPITRKAFTFHCFDSTVELPFPHPKID
ncbi:flocculation protein FLO11-like [Lactuca sativa]|uniref:flocculation protein FLO11-like n=1 Tax=Lactuca sativa TaxID=4236 RepID=UPI000CD92F01|nr:flocculation protein FLO11-like [Lactuca sativa]